MKRVPRIIVAFEIRPIWGQHLLRGIAAFVDRYGPWDCDLTRVVPFTPETIRQATLADGMIIRIGNEQSKMAAAVGRLKLPVVGLGMTAPKNIPHVHHDFEAIGRMAAEHLLERGFRNFGFVSLDDIPQNSPIVLRRKSFMNIVEAANCRCAYFQLRNPVTTRSWRPDHARLVKWVESLPKPVAIWGAADFEAREVAIACRDADISIPQEVAVVGDGNDQLLCCLCSPQLSSVEVASEKVGFEAARLLHQMLHGEKVPPGPRIFPPIRVVVRESSDTVTVEDQRVAEAVHYIHQHLGEGVSVKQIIQHFPMSRRALELAFRKHLGRTVHREIVRARLQRATRLLEDGDLPIATITRLCGIRHPRQFSDFFKKHHAMTPLEYRKKSTRKQF